MDDVCGSRVDLYGEFHTLYSSYHFVLFDDHDPRPGLTERFDWMWHFDYGRLAGPFWILTTLILTIYLSTSLSTSLSPSSSSEPTVNGTDKDLTLLTFITTLIYLYGLAFPAAFWGVVRYLSLRSAGNEAGEGGGGSWSLAEAWAVWGYGMVVWVPISVSPTLAWQIERLRGTS